MIITILLVVTANLATGTLALYTTVDEIHCKGDGDKATFCLVPNAKTWDLIYLEARLTSQSSPNGCDKGSYSLEVKSDQVYLTVSKNCDGNFNILKAECGVTDDSFRIVNGKRASSCKQFPWMARINDSCGASILNRNHILTAAHCVVSSNSSNPPNPSSFTISIGSIKIRTAQKYKVDKIFVHENYNNFTLPHRDSYVNDIAVLRLKEDLKFDECQRPICLAKCANKLNLLSVKNSCVVSGWGSTEDLSKGYPKALRWVKMQTISSAECRSDFALNILLGGFLCAKARGSSIGGHCDGDSGGPLVCKHGDRWEEYGVVSLYRMSIACGTRPSGYTSVPYYYKWIISKINSP